MMKKVLYRIMSNGITNRGRRVFWSLSFIVVILGAGLFSNNNASAAATKTDVMRKWVYTQYYYCAMNHINQEINVESNGLVADSVFSNEEEDVMLPSYDFEYNLDRIANDFTYDKITCRQLFEGFDGFNHGVLDYSGLNKNVKWQNRTAANDFLDQIGYYLEENNTFSFRIQAMMKVDGDAPYIVYSPNIIGEYKEDQHRYEYSVDGGDLDMDSSNNFAEYGLGVSIKEQQLTVFAYPPNPFANCMAIEDNTRNEYPRSILIGLKGAGFEDTAETIKNELENKTMVVSCYDSRWGEGRSITFSFDIPRDDIVVSSAAKYKYGEVKYQSSTTIGAIYRMMSGQKAQVSGEVKIVNEMMTLDPAERYLLYEHYLRNSIPDFVEDKIVCDVDEGLNNLEEVLLKVDGTIKRCYVNFGGADIDSIVVSTQGTEAGAILPDIKTISMRDVVNWLNDPDNVNKDNLAGVMGMDKTDFNDLEGETCGSGGAAGSLGWILCPLLNFMQGSTESLYEGFVEPALTVSPKLFSVSNSDSEDGNGAVYNAWEIFQRFSNIAFIILLLVVIFSQLTGVGIDNYGIKKILPKMIVGVILINVSYYVCLLAIDLSNVIGVGIQNIFEKMGDGIPFGKIEGQEFVYGSMGSVSFLAVIMTISTIWANPAILLSLLVSALGLLISIVFMFLILSARQAMLVVLTVVAPVAIACYILPNTKTVFSKWLKAGWMLLLVFPICGLMVGGGNFVSKLLLGVADGNIYSALIAMVAGIAPIFFIPSVLKWSLTAVGKVGGVLSGLGNMARRGATSKIRQSEGYKAAQARSLERKTRIKAGFDSKGNVTERGAWKAKFAGTRFGRAIGYQGLQAARVGAANKSREQNIQQNAELRDVGLKYDMSKDPTRRTEDYLRRMLQEAAESGDGNAIFSTIEQMKRSNMQASHIAEATRQYLGGNSLKMEAGQRKNFLEEFGKKYSGDFLKKDLEQADWARRGGIDRSNNTAMLGVGGQWAHYNMDISDIKDDDVAALSSDRLYDLMAAGMITQPQAQRVWASNGNMDDANRLMLGAYGNGDNGSPMIITKNDAEKALTGRFEGSAAGLNQQMVRAYTERAATDTRIRDVEWRNREGEHRQTDPLIVAGLHQQADSSIVPSNDEHTTDASSDSSNSTSS